MKSIDDIIKALSLCVGVAVSDCDDCPYRDAADECIGYELRQDTIALLEAQRPRLLDVDNLSNWDGPVFIESRTGKPVWAYYYTEYERYDQPVVRMVDEGGDVDDRFRALYGYEWRCWDKRPSDEQREAEPWKG